MKKAKKKGPAPKGRRSAAPTKKPFRLEVGKTYETRGGFAVEVVRKYTEGERSAFTVWGKFLNGHGKNGNSLAGWETPFGRRGQFWDMRKKKEDEWDLVREVPPPKSPKGRGK